MGRSGTVSRRTLLSAAASATMVPLVGHASAPAKPLREIPLPRGFQPEGITAYTRYFAVGSLANGRILLGDLYTGQLEEVFSGFPGALARGLAYDPRTNWIWAVGQLTSDDGSSSSRTVAHIIAVSVVTKQIVANYAISDAKYLNDLVISDRTLIVTDSQVDRLIVIGLNHDGSPNPSAGIRFVALTGDWPMGDGTTLNANGIRFLANGSTPFPGLKLDPLTLVLDNSRVGGLWQVNPYTGDTRKIILSGLPAIVGGDGLERVGTTMYVVRGSTDSSVTAVGLVASRGALAGRVSHSYASSRLQVPSTAAFALSGLYAVNARYGVTSPQTADYWITRIELD